MPKQLRDWLNANDESRRKKVASDASTSVAYLWQLAGGHRKASLEMAKRLQDASGGELTIEGLRPDVFSPRSTPKLTPGRATPTTA